MTRDQVRDLALEAIGVAHTPGAAIEYAQLLMLQALVEAVLAVAAEVEAAR